MNFKKTIFLFLLSFISLGILAQDGYKIGDNVTDFKLPNIDGKQYAMADFPDAKGFILIFTCNTCPYAVAYEDRIIELHEKFAPQGYPVVAVNPNDPKAQPKDSMEDMRIRAEEKGFNFLYLQDVGQEVYPKFGATKTPHVFLLNKENEQLVLKYIGAIDDNYKDGSQVEEKFLEDAIEALMNGEKIKTTETKAIGCTIKTVTE